jgi:acyl-CoA synthetase (NDP forming)
VLRDPNVDSLIVIFIPVGLAGGDAVAAALRRAVAAAATTEHSKPVLACFMAGQGILPGLRGETGHAIPSFRFPESAARALARVTAYAEWRRRPLGEVPVLDHVDAAATRAVVGEILRTRGEGWLRPDEAARLLGTAGIELPPFAIAPTAQEAAAAAERIGFPVALKVVSDAITHKSDVGGVLLGLETREAVVSACEAMRQAIGAPVQGFLVQRMVARGVEVIMGVVDDESFGPLLGFGLGGTAAEVLNDVVFRITPLTDDDARQMVRSVRSLPLLEGYRGAPKADLDAVQNLLLRLSWLVEQLPEIVELDLNPVVVYAAGQGLAIPDARIRIRRVTEDPPATATRSHDGTGGESAPTSS